jgi:S-adenosyl-L-methionine hydrolase (adenosine-forming)
VARPITFLSDYGYDDEFAGVCRAVIARIAPAAPLIDLTHGIARHSIEEGAAVLANALPFTAPGVHLAVVDPGVGSTRKAVALRTSEEDRLLVGPDNGLLWPALERFGGAAEAVDLATSPFRLEPISATFHGRDIFAPVAARLAVGARLADAGEPIDAGSLVELSRTEPEIEGERVVVHVVYADRYGNLSLDLSHDRLPESGLRLGRRVWVEAAGLTLDAVYAVTFADVGAGDLVLYEDSYRNLALAINRASAADRLGVGPGDRVVLRPAT